MVKEEGRMIRVIQLFLTIQLLRQSECQNNVITTVDPFIGVNVSDSTPTVTDDVEKIYTTKLLLTKNFPDAVFVGATFSGAAASVYGQLQGYNGIRDIVSTDQANDIQITYSAVYVYNTLNLTSTDDEVIAKIGNLEAVRAGLISTASTFTTLFNVANDPTTFLFTGNSLCSISSVRCTQGSNIACSEMKNGTTLLCVSPCKLEYCKHNGICTQSNANTPPVCACPTQSDLWYLGKQCETLLTLWMVILIALAIFLLIVIAIVVMCVCYYRKKRRLRKEHKEKEKISYLNRAYVEENANIVAVTKAESEQRYHSHRERERHSRHRRHSSSRSRERRRSYDRKHRRSYTPEETTTPSKHASSTSEEYTTSEDEQNIAAYEIDVSEIINQGPDKKDTSTSPVRWLPVSESEASEQQVNPNVGVDIGSRPGWRPSLGPNMFDLKQSIEDLHQVGETSVTSEEPYQDITLPYGKGRFVGETDL